MPKYTYKAINENGKEVTGEIEADSVDTANNILGERGLIPLSFNELEKGKSKGSQDFFNNLTTVTTDDLILFTKQMRTMLRAGISILNLLKTLENQTENPKLKKIINIMISDIQEGSNLHHAFAKHKKVFSNLYCSMIKAGEISGSLSEVLDRLTYIIEHEHKVNSDIKSALRYPMIVLSFLVIAFFILLTFVIPKFARIFISAGLVLPMPTKICIILNSFLVNYWFLILISIVGSSVALALFLKTEQGQYVKTALMMKIPILGRLFLKASMSRFASIFSILQSSGVSVLESMDILADTIGNAAIKREFKLISERLAEGKGIAAPLNASKYFTPMVINMVAIGEESGQLDEMLKEIALHYDSEVEYSMKGLSDAIGPLLTLGLAVVVGFFALAIFLPMWDLTKMAG